MHQIIDEILNSTRRRIPYITNAGRKKIISRNFGNTMREKQQKSLIPVIAEVKPSSPTRFIRNVTPREAAHIAIQMESAGAAAISVLTEPRFFKGSIKNLISVRDSVKIPVLRKDFIINKAQIHEVESDLILLIAGILGDALEDFVNEAISSGRQPVVEVHNKFELEQALLSSAEIIGINNRDLTTMKVDISTTEKLAPLAGGRIIISESGISTPEDAIRMIGAGTDAILVGTSIMQGNVYEKTYELVHASGK
ncbi:MAG: indole-3-glycerol-phosphate synthase [Candidatus Methanoperedens sp.]|nr:indole-3-glycerol-phosphate synthase [Candidatus Methanoperedens sp.]MCE8424231.1 indole-3-glycerol-phosphate synthase [Candidatus Methanoperedens sp.]MCE8427690.1 indole-3-glycerol-phosphate synthase [Candidatus Methanoperedens sp.]